MVLMSRFQTKHLPFSPFGTYSLAWLHLGRACLWRMLRPFVGLTEYLNLSKTSDKAELQSF